MKFNELSSMMQKPEPKPDTYEAGMALNQLLKIGTHAIKIHNMIDNNAEMEAWVAKKIDLASNYVKSVHGYTAGSKAGTYNDGGLTTEGGMPASVIKHKQKLAHMSDEELADRFKDFDEQRLRQMAWRHGYGKMSSHYLDRVRNHMTSKRTGTPTSEDAQSDELKRWYKNYSRYSNLNGDKLPFGLYMQLSQTGVPTDGMAAHEASRAILDAGLDADAEQNALSGGPIDSTDVDFDKADQRITDAMKQELADIMGVDAIGEEEITKAMKMLGVTTGMESLEARLEAKLRESREQIGDYAREIKTGKIVRIVDYTDDDEGIYTISYGDGEGEMDVTAKDLKFLDQTGMDQEEISKFDEDAGEGHMSKSQLYQTAKMAIELLDMIKKGDDLEGWVQTKLNLAADYLQAVYHYEDYQKLNPYREELNPNILQRHAGIIQKHLDEILERKCRTEDVDTKPGMMRILKKRVNEVEKEIAKENRKETNEGPLDSIGKAIGTAARGLGAKAAGKLGMKKTAAGLQGRVDVDKKSAELDNGLAQYIGQQRADKNRIDPKILQGFLQKQGIDQKYMQYVKGPINQQQASKLMDKIAADSFAGNVPRKQPQDMAKSVAQRANQMKGVLGQQGGSAQQVAKGLGKAAQGQRMDPAQIKQLAPYAGAIQNIMANPKLAQVFRQLIMRANKVAPTKRTVTADVNEMDLDEGKIKDWAKSLAIAGIFVAGLAGVGSINDAINNSVPAIQAMNTALEMAKERGDDNLVAQIEKDLKGAKLRLDIGKDLNQVKYLQDKYEKFIQTESLTYESKLQINLNQRLK